jgi:hypothetical protein
VGGARLGVERLGGLEDQDVHPSAREQEREKEARGAGAYHDYLRSCQSKELVNSPTCLCNLRDMAVVRFPLSWTIRSCHLECLPAVVKGEAKDIEICSL